jgi:hypothetical protein
MTGHIFVKPLWFVGVEPFWTQPKGQGMKAAKQRQGMGLAEAHFGAARLFDKRRTQRLVESARRVLEHPHGSLPHKMGDDAATQGLYGLLDCPQVRHDSVLEAHRQRTLERMGQVPVVLIVHDPTELDYSHVMALKEQLGQIGTGSRWGYICHNSLAITPQRQILGLANQILHKRRRVPRTETALQKRQHPQRESRLWLAAAQAIGPAPPGALWVDIADRGADTFEFLAYQRRHGRHFVIRCAKDRKLAGEDHVGADRVYQTLHAYTRDLPTLGRRQVQVAAVPGVHPARIAQVRVAAGAVTVTIPHFVRGEAQEPSLDLWVIHVQEIDAPAGTQPLEWILLTDLPCRTLQQTQEKIDFYECRPVVEDYHKAMKTGLGIEQMQFAETKRLEPAIALLSVSAAVLLELRYLAQDEQSEHIPAEQVLPKLHVQVLSLWRWNELRPISAKEAWRAIARLGGHLNARPPGWLTLWRGWTRLQDMVRGALAIQGHKCDQS